MTDSQDMEAQPLPDELVSALRRTATETLTALLTLRIAVRDHVRSERARGATLAEIDSDLKEMIDVVVESDSDPYSPHRIVELETHVLKLSETFYNGPSRPKKA